MNLIFSIILLLSCHIHSSPLSDITSSDMDIVSERADVKGRPKQHYTVYPSNPSDKLKLVETKKYILNIGNGDVLDNRSNNQLISWRIGLDDESLEQIQDHAGISLIELEEFPLPLSLERQA